MNWEHKKQHNNDTTSTQYSKLSVDAHSSNELFKQTTHNSICTHAANEKCCRIENIR